MAEVTAAAKVGRVRQAQRPASKGGPKARLTLLAQAAWCIHNCCALPITRASVVPAPPRLQDALRKCEAMPAFQPGASAGGLLDSQALLARQPLEPALAALRCGHRAAPLSALLSLCWTAGLAGVAAGAAAAEACACGAQARAEGRAAWLMAVYLA